MPLVLLVELAVSPGWCLQGGSRNRRADADSRPCFWYTERLANLRYEL